MASMGKRNLGIFENSPMNKTFHLTMFAILLAIGLVLHYIESFFSIPFAGFIVKVGISNIVIVYLLVAKNTKEAAMLAICKVVFSLFFSPTINFNNFLISLGGALLSLVLMVIVYCILHQSIILTSIFGGIFHNLGQLAVVLFLMKMNLPRDQVFFFLPVFIILGSLSGFLVGLTAKLLLSKLSNIHEKRDYNSR